LNLPDLNLYQKEYAAKNVTLPLSEVKNDDNGLLKVLPKPPEGKTGWPWTEETEVCVYDEKINWPKLSIITPSYNQGDFLEETIRSVLLQNYPNLEYIIIDGGSSDQSTGIIEKYSPWISYWQSEKDRGQGHAINQGFSIASGTYFAWINSDDYYLRNVFHDVISTFLNTQVSFIYGYSYDFDVSDKSFDLVKTDPFLDYFIRFPSLIQPSCFWNANIHQPIWEDLHCSMDYELWLRMVKGKSRKLLRKPLSVVSIHEAAKTHNPKMKIAWEHDHELICSPDAHGPVKDWNKKMLFKKLFINVNKLLNLK
jgi:glycosyltransferase involved in cell wall biosynthesis